MKKIISLGVVLGGIMPSFAFALVATTDAFSVLGKVNILLNKYVIPLLITLAVVYFIWGIIQYTISTDEETKKGARGKIIAGLIGLFIILTFWGIVYLVGNTLGINAGNLNPLDMPCIAGPGVVC